MAPPDVEAVARRIEAAFRAGPDASRRALAALYAPEVELRHEPPLAVDGTVDGMRLGESAEREAAAVTGVLRGSRFDAVRVTVDGDVVTVRAELWGVLPDGAAARLPSHMRCVVSDGRISAITHVMGPEAMRAWAEVAVAGGHAAANALLGDGDAG